VRSLGQGCLLHRKLVCDIVMRWFVSNHFKLHNNCHCDVKVAVVKVSDVPLLSLTLLPVLLPVNDRTHVRRVNANKLYR